MGYKSINYTFNKEIIMDYAVVTGAYGGMGRATVELLTKKGFTVFALDRKVEDPTPNVIPVEVDVTSEESVLRAVEKITAVTNEIKAVVHFAGIYILDSLVEITEERFIRAFNVNLFGVYRINKALLPLLKNNSRVVITASELAPLDPLPFTGLYAITKSALEKYAYSLRMELQLLGIKVSVIRPGAVKTGLLKNSTDELSEFCSRTRIYTYNAKRFKKIVDSVEAKNVEPIRVAKKAFKAITAKHPKYLYNLNRNPLLILLNLLPRRLQTAIIKGILKEKKRA